MSKDNNEIGIIELLDYFKNGIKSIFRWIGNFFKGILNLIVQFLLIVKKNIILILVCIVIFIGLWYYLNNTPDFENYGYQLVVKPNYNSTDALFNQIQSLSDNKGDKGETDFEKNLLGISITPIESLNDEVKSYYDVINGEYSTNKVFQQSYARDTVYFRQIELENFKEQLTDRDYKIFKINLKTRKLWNESAINQALFSSINKNKLFQNFKNQYLSQLKKEEKNYDNSIRLIDTILLARTNTESVVSQENISFQDGGNNKVLEQELLKEKDLVQNKLSENILKQIQNAEIIEVISPAEKVTPERRVKRGLPYFVLYGFLFSLGIIFLLWLNKYLRRIDNSAKSE